MKHKRLVKKTRCSGGDHRRTEDEQDRWILTTYNRGRARQISRRWKKNALVPRAGVDLKTQTLENAIDSRIVSPARFTSVSTVTQPAARARPTDGNQVRELAWPPTPGEREAKFDAQRDSRSE
jgi:hypothetical protein